MKLLILAETIDVTSSSAGKANYALVRALLSAGFEITVYHYSHKEIHLPGVQAVLIQEKKTDINYWLSRGQRVLQRITKKNFSKLLENRLGFSFTFFNDVNSMVAVLKPLPVEDYDLVFTLSKGASYRTHTALLKLPQWHAKWLAYIHDPFGFKISIKSSHPVLQTFGGVAQTLRLMSYFLKKSFLLNAPGLHPIIGFGIPMKGIGIVYIGQPFSVPLW